MPKNASIALASQDGATITLAVEDAPPHGQIFVNVFQEGVGGMKYAERHDADDPTFELSGWTGQASVIAYLYSSDHGRLLAYTSFYATL